MADISLRDYLAKLDALLNDGASDEVIHHCRHILQYYPKNAAAYRYLGRALVEAGNWEKAGEVFRRVLSVYPDDFTAHAGLSEVYLSLKRSEDAIWHLERAYEQDPNNQEIIDRLRELYWKVRHVEQAKVQLTAGAVARQYIRNGLYDQAISTLKQALERSPERVDLRLLLAQTNADAGHDIEAGETALGVLEVLPDCLEANRILTDMWLGVQRPSDAQRYLSRIQAVDPYLALELAQGQPVPDEQFRLEELDYRQSAQKEIVSRAPDWLQQIEPSAPADTGAETDMGDWMSAISVSSAASTPADTPEFSDELFSTELPEDWLTAPAADTAEAEPPPAESRPRTGLTGLLSVLNEPEDEAEALPEGDSGAEAAVDLFPALDEAEPSAETVEPAAELEELPDLFGDAEPSPPPTPPRAAAGEADPLAWLHEHGIELVEEPAADLFDDEDIIPVQAMDEVNPLAWLQGYGEEFIDQEAHPSGTPVMAEEELAAPAEPVAEQPPEVLPSAPSAVDPLDWLADESLLEEALSLEALTGPEADTAGSDEIVWAQDTTLQSDGQGVMAEDNPFAWLDDNQPPEDEKRPDLSADDWFAESEPADVISQPAADQPPPAEPSGELEWLVSESEAPSSAADLEWLSGGEEPEPQAEPASEMPEWLMQAQPPEEEETPAEAEAPAAASEFGWLPEAQAIEEEPETAGASDWLSELQTRPAAGEAELAAEATEEPWSFDSAAGDEEAAPAEAVPDWLSEMQTRPAEVEAPEVEATGGLSWMDEAPVSDDAVADSAAEWLAEADQVSIPAAGMATDWLNELESQQPEAEAQEPEAVSSFDWMSDLEAEEAEPAVIEPEMAPAGEPVETLDWMGDLGEVEEEPQPLAGLDVPVAEAEPVDEFDWGDEPVSEAASTTDMPDWLRAVSPVPEEEAEASEPVSAGFSWIDDINASAEVEEADELADFPEAMVEPIPDDEDALQEELAQSPASNAPDWLNAMVPGLDVDSIVTTGEFEATSEVVEEELQPLEPGSAPASRKDFDWLMDIVDEETQQQPAVLEENERKRFVFSRQPSWLRQPVERQDDTPAPKPDRSSTTDDHEPDLPPWLQ